MCLETSLVANSTADTGIILNSILLGGACVHVCMLAMMMLLLLSPWLVGAADAECIVSVIVLMVSRLEKDGNLAETASKLATSIGKQVGCVLGLCVRVSEWQPCSSSARQCLCLLLLLLLLLLLTPQQRITYHSACSPCFAVTPGCLYPSFCPFKCAA